MDPEEPEFAAEEERSYEDLELGGMPACPRCGEDLSLPRREARWCPACGGEVGRDHPSRRRRRHDYP